MDTKLYTSDGVLNSLQVSFLGNIPSGSFQTGRNFLVKNITEDNVTAEIFPASSTTWISTVLYPGWNPEIIKGVRGVTDNTLQYGY